MNDAADATRPPNARLVIDLTALRRGIVGGLVVIVPVSLVVALVSHDRRTGYGGWLFVAFVAILYGYATAGYGAARARPDAPLAHGMLAGLGAFLIWLLVRLAVPLVARRPPRVRDRRGRDQRAVRRRPRRRRRPLRGARRGPTALPRD